MFAAEQQSLYPDSLYGTQACHKQAFDITALSIYWRFS